MDKKVKNEIRNRRGKIMLNKRRHQRRILSKNSIQERMGSEMEELTGRKKGRWRGEDRMEGYGEDGKEWMEDG